MHRCAKPGKPRWRRKTPVFLGWASLGLCAVLGASGCSTMHQATNEKLGDPLLGPTPHPAGQPATPRGGTSAGLPPIPAGGASTTAALASQSSPGQSLSIGDSDGWLRRVDGAPTASG